MEKNETMTSLFTNISQVRYQLLRIGVMVDDGDIIQSTIDGLPSSWETFLATIYGQDVQSKFEILWHCFQ